MGDVTIHPRAQKTSPGRCELCEQGFVVLEDTITIEKQNLYHGMDLIDQNVHIIRGLAKTENQAYEEITLPCNLSSGLVIDTECSPMSPCLIPLQTGVDEKLVQKLLNIFINGIPCQSLLCLFVDDNAVLSIGASKRKWNS
ncbi:hypothetical protein AVEN_20164-1 [Araneus ventricosus]|uniref:Uncharacterized protein n=1 Tax=Araneus ventricosus TaxID=182803 RepID=A0A4Y2QHP6_ARAVE|nr:hypothetical protein AVEN_185375-1 [Araneus ventricosus]GBN61483.1 hypothetical protein AVEN_185097-1 [Araneus ventricosus]GBN62821.1 hypothetical protein AVEN_140426-1 [Araneus ventricosus]GBN62868.1 hypothetical protein AVEN_20164-1 [Araneus ventricosus]